MLFRSPAAGPKLNHIGLPVVDYQGSKSTLCAGCGHDVITNTIISALWEMGVEPHKVAKMSGIGCSSKTTNYFLNRSWGFNAVHGRMPSVGAYRALGPSARGCAVRHYHRKAPVKSSGRT